MRSAWLVAAGLLFGLATPVWSAPASAARTPAPSPKPSPTPAGLKLSPEVKARGNKTLAAAVGKRQEFGAKRAAPAAAGFQAHRCAVLFDVKIFGKAREENGPFRTTCSDWVSRKTQALATHDVEQPCAEAQYGPNFAGCTSWVDHWDAGSSKWAVVWQRSSP